MIATHYSDGVPICFGDTISDGMVGSRETLEVVHPREFLETYYNAEKDKTFWIPVYDPSADGGAGGINGYDQRIVHLVNRAGVELQFEDAYPGDLVRLEKGNEIHQFVVGDYEDSEDWTGLTEGSRTLYATGHAGSYSQAEGWELTRIVPSVDEILGAGYITMEYMLTELP